MVAEYPSGKRQRSGNRQVRFVNRLAEMVTRHQNNMIRRAVIRGRSVPLQWLQPSYWWFRRCGWHTLPDFEGNWRWWCTLDITAQYTLMRLSRSRDFD